MEGIVHDGQTAWDEWDEWDRRPGVFCLMLHGHELAVPRTRSALASVATRGTLASPRDLTARKPVWGGRRSGSEGIGWVNGGNPHPHTPQPSKTVLEVSTWYYDYVSS